MASVARRFPQHLKELRIHLCQRSPASEGARYAKLLSYMINGKAPSIFCLHFLVRGPTHCDQCTLFFLFSLRFCQRSAIPAPWFSWCVRYSISKDCFVYHLYKVLSLTIHGITLIVHSDRTDCWKSTNKLRASHPAHLQKTNEMQSLAMGGK